MTNVLLRTIAVRYIVFVMTFLGFMINYILRNNINITIVAMVNHTALNMSTAGEPIDGPFVWDENIVGLILGSFYYGYICTQVIGGRAAELTSVKYIYGVSLLSAGLLTFLIPTAANWDYRLLVTVRISMGLSLGVGFPAGYTLLRRWTPPNERSTVIAVTVSASNIGAAVTMPLASAIINSFSWEAVFYIQGSFAIVWFLFWALLVYKSPRDHPFITTEERDYIVNAVGSQQASAPLPVPWADMLSSPVMWSVIIANFCRNWGFYTLLNDLPQYFSYILGKDISSSATFTSLPFLGCFLFGLVYGRCSDYLQARRLMTVTNIRRLAQFVSEGLTGCCLIGVAYLGHDTVAVEVLLFMALGLTGASFSGWQCSPLEIAPNYAGTIVGIANTFGSIPGFAAPAVVGALTENHQTLDRWRWCFLIPAALMMFDTIFFCTFGTAEEQSWNRKYYGPESRTGQSDAGGARVTDEDDDNDDENQRLIGASYDGTKTSPEKVLSTVGRGGGSYGAVESSGP